MIGCTQPRFRVGNETRGRVQHLPRADSSSETIFRSPLPPIPNGCCPQPSKARCGRTRWVSIETRPGEVWAVDFGLAANQRPVLILAYPQPENARALVVVVPLNSQLRGLWGEVDIGKPRLASQALRSEYSRICRNRPTRPDSQTRQVVRRTVLSGQGCHSRDVKSFGKRVARR